MRKCIYIFAVSTLLILSFISFTAFSNRPPGSDAMSEIEPDELLFLHEEQEKMRLIACKYPDPPITFATALLKDLTAKNPTILLDIAIDISELIAGKYPMLPYEVITWKAEENTKGRSIDIINKKYPAFHQDFFLVLEQGEYPDRFAAIREGIAGVMSQKYPGMGARIKLEIDQLIHTSYPELPGRIARIHDNQQANPRFEVVKLICTSYPGLIPEILKEVRKNHGPKVHQAAIDILIIIEQKQPGILGDLRNDMMRMTSRKYPQMMQDMMVIQLGSAKTTARKIEAQYPGLHSDLTGLLKEKYPTLKQEIDQSMQKNFPDAGAIMNDHRPGLGSKAEDERHKKAWIIKGLLMWDEMDRLGRIF